MDAIPELPALEQGLQLLDVETDVRGGAVGPLAALVVDHLLGGDGPAYWIDACGHARTEPLSSVAPSDRVLDRVQVARGFTAHQHFALGRRLRERVDGGTSLLVLPAVDARYRADDLRTGEGRRLLLRVLATVRTLAREHDLAVLVTRSTADAFAEPVATAAGTTIACERTRFGPRFRTDGFETTVYPQRDGTLQTTLAFWREVLAARQATVGASATGADRTPASREVTVDGAH